MTLKRRQKLHTILDEAMQRSAAERPDFLAAACGEDLELRGEIEEILAFEDEADHFLEEPLVDLGLRANVAAAEPQLARRIGPYETVELLGKGGMGEVYLAARVDDFEQRVALKLLPCTATDEEVLRRFRTERQIQARLEHPHISRLLDGGTTEDGRPYFVMEYVDGVPIDIYCHQRALSMRERLALFCEVCAAVHFAHQHLVVHRDLKPSNILVTADGEPKLLDFGIAKLLRGGDADDELETRPGATPMTPRYASPEQVRGERISTPSDVWALGVLLYELLTGRLPFALESVGFAEAIRRICCEDPEPPSIAGGSSGAPPEPAGHERDGEARKPRRRLRGDLDAIVLKTLRKDPRERYGSAAGLAEDLHRHLAGLPVVARRGTLRYRAGKFLRRHRWQVASAAAVLAVALLSAVWEWRRLDAERERAQKVTAFLEQLFTAADPDERRGHVLSVREILDRGRDELETLAGEPRLHAALVGTLGRIHYRLGHYREARELLARSLEIWRRDHPGDAPELARRLSNLGVVHHKSGAYGEAEALYREALAVRQRLGQEGPELVKTLNNLAAVVALRGAHGEAEALYRHGLEIRRQWNTPDSPAVASSLRRLAWVLLSRGELAEAEAAAREALKVRRARHGEHHTEVAGVLHLLGRVRLAAGDRQEAEALFQEALAIRRELLGDAHLAVARTRRQLAALLLTAGESPATVAVLLERVLETFYRVKPPGDWEIADAEGLLGAHLAARGRTQEAEHCLVRSWEVLAATRGKDALPTREARQRLAFFREDRRASKRAAAAER